MGLITGIKNLSNAILNRGMVHANSNWWDGLGFGLSGTKFNFAAKVGNGQDSSVVMAPVMWVAKNSVQAPPEVLQLDGDDEIRQDGHALTKLLRKPNKFYTGKQLQMGTLICMLTQLDAYWIKIFNKDGTVAETWLAPAHLMEPMTLPGTANSEFIDYYKYTPGGEEIRLAPEQVTHFRIGINPVDPRHGMGILYPVLREVYTDTEAANFTAALLRNMGIPGIILSPKNSEKGEVIGDVQGVKDKFVETFGGDERGKVMVNKIAVNVEQFGFNPDQMKLGDIRNIPEERMCAMIGIQPSVIAFGTGQQQTKVGATAAENRASSWEDGIIVYLDVMADTLSDSLLPHFEEDPEAFRVNYRLGNVRALRESQDALYKRVNSAINSGWMRVDQGQALAGLEPDTTQQIYLRRGNQIEVSAGVKGRDKPQYSAALKADSRVRRILAIGTKANPTRDQARLMAQYNRDVRVLEPPFEADTLTFLKRWAGTIADAAEEVLTPKQLAETQLILDKVDLTTMENQLKELYEEQYRRTADTTLNSLNNVMGITIGSPDIVAQQTVAAGGRQAGLVDLSGSTRRKLFKILAQAEEAGLGVPETVRLIRDTVTAGRFATTEIRARLIARTETLHAQRESSLAAYKQISGVDTVLVFDARLGETDEECANLDGTTVTIADAEVLSAEEHPNGTRAFAPQVT